MGPTDLSQMARFYNAKRKEPNMRRRRRRKVGGMGKAWRDADKISRGSRR
jgi:hypothetical protein